MVDLEPAVMLSGMTLYNPSQQHLPSMMRMRTAITPMSMNLGALVSLIVVTTVTRYLDDEKKRKLDDTALYRHMLDHISLDSIRLIELDPAYLGLSHSLYGYSPVISLFRRCNDKLL
jgi:hypothetical protein